MKKKIRLIDLFCLQGVVVVYTLSSIFAKFATGNGLLTKEFFVFLVLDFLVLVVYAVLWQQMIKRFDLSIAYANRAIAPVWSLVWAAIIFHNPVTVRNVIGAIIVIVGIMIINKPEQEEEKRG